MTEIDSYILAIVWFELIVITVAFGSLVFLSTARCVWRDRTNGTLEQYARSGKSPASYSVRRWLVRLAVLDVLMIFIFYSMNNLETAHEVIAGLGMEFGVFRWLRILFSIAMCLAVMHIAFSEGVYFGVRGGHVSHVLHIGFFAFLGVAALSILGGLFAGTVITAIIPYHTEWVTRIKLQYFTAIIATLFLGIYLSHLGASRAVRTAFDDMRNIRRKPGLLKRIAFALWERCKGLFRDYESMDPGTPTADGAVIIEQREIASRRRRATIVEIIILALPLAIWLTQSRLIGKLCVHGSYSRHLESVTMIAGIPFLIYFPLITAVVAFMAAFSFFAEKRSGTLEPLLLTPISLRDVFFGKVRAAQRGARMMSKYIIISWLFLTALPTIVLICLHFNESNRSSLLTPVLLYVLLLLTGLLLAPRSAAAIGCVIGVVFTSPLISIVVFVIALTVFYFPCYFIFFMSSLALLHTYSVIAGLAGLIATIYIFNIALPRLLACVFESAYYLNLRERFFLPFRRLFQVPRRLLLPVDERSKKRGCFFRRCLYSPAFIFFRTVLLAGFVVAALSTVQCEFRSYYRFYPDGYGSNMSWRICIDMNDETMAAILVMAFAAFTYLLVAGAGAVLRDRRYGLIARFKEEGVSAAQYLRREEQRHLGFIVSLSLIVAAVCFIAFHHYKQFVRSQGFWPVLLMVGLVSLYGFFVVFYLGIYIAAVREKLRDVVFEGLLLISGYGALLALITGLTALYLKFICRVPFGLTEEIVVIIMTAEVFILGFMLTRALAKASLRRLWETTGKIVGNGASVTGP